MKWLVEDSIREVYIKTGLFGCIDIISASHYGKPADLKFEEMDQHKLAWSHFPDNDPVFKHFSYIRLPESKEIVSGHFYVYSDGTGIFVSRCYEDKAYTSDKLKVRFFKFGCKHDYVKTRNLGHCYHEFTCTKCGHSENIDSGD